jgi:hypothetical protein
VQLLLVGLRHLLAPKEAEKQSEQGREVDDLKMTEILVNSRFMPIRANSLSPSMFEAILTSFLSKFCYSTTAELTSMSETLLEKGSFGIGLEGRTSTVIGAIAPSTSLPST